MIRVAQVIDNNDPDKKGRVKVKIFPELIDVKDDLLPWVAIYTDGSGTSETIGVHKVLEENTFIRVLIEDWPNLHSIRYISDDYVDGLYIYDSFEDISIDELGTQTYPQPSFKKYKDGTIEFHNSETGEHGIFYKNGNYFLSDKDGKVYLNNKSQEVKVYNNEGSFHLKNDGDVEIISNKDLTLTISGNTKIETTGNTDLKTTGNTTIDTTGNTQIKSTGTVNIQGASVTMQGTTNLVSPTGSGPFCALPACLFTGAPHVGSTLS